MQQMRTTDPVDACQAWTADSVMLLALMLARRWGGASLSPVAPLAGKTLGLVGFDPVARAVARRACYGFGMRVLIHGVCGEQQVIASRLGAKVSPSLSHLLGASDVVSLHARPGDAAAFINAHRLNQMRPDACLINAVDGALVDEQALIHALWFETIGGAGIAAPPETLDRLADFEAAEHAIMLPAFADAPMPFASPLSPSLPDNVINLFEGRQHA